MTNTNTQTETMKTTAEPRTVTHSQANRIAAAAITGHRKAAGDFVIDFEGDTISIWPDSIIFLDSRDACEAIATKIAAELRTSVHSNGGRFWVYFRNHPTPLGDWNDKASAHHY